MSNLNRREFLRFTGWGVASMAVSKWLDAAENTGDLPKKPNIIFILCDDLGYGDVHCLNPERGKIPTPNFDKLAEQGMIFTEAHSSSSLCSPSRYGVLTGRYNWRSRLQSGIVGHWGDPLIDRERLTVAGLLKQNGYATACIGKWHLGWKWPEALRDPKLAKSKTPETGEATDEQKSIWKEAFSLPIAEGPTTRGFDYYFGTDVPNWPPYCFIENDRTMGIPSQFLPARLLKNNQASSSGPALEGWKLEPILPALADKACEYISRQVKESKPFFIYMPLTSPHTPLAVTDEWKGKSGLGQYADFVMETDAMIGRVIEAVDKSGAAGNTLIFVSSDNGCAPYIGVPEMEKNGHYPSEKRRGYKADAWDGGHRMPFIVRWPVVVKPGSSCRQMICLTDLMATCSEIVGAKLPDPAGEDSVSILSLIKGEDKPVRDAVVHHSGSGKFAIRDNKWKLQLCAGSGGGWTSPRDYEAVKAGLPPIQLYDVTQDVGEQKNLQAEHPEVVERLTKLLEKYVADGRSTPGVPQKNDVEIDIWKKNQPVRKSKGKLQPKGEK
ncbi:MAG: arylsulfatase [Kiritimatiellae bacterium]|nr:arylsulfatase [Kiritimatiellia bacterium]MDD5519945.1 arylsulfatase [Kiritimatiellia bacterium]